MGGLNGEELEIVCESLKEHKTLTELSIRKLNINENAAKWICKFNENFTAIIICLISLFFFVSHLFDKLFEKNKKMENF